MSGLAAGQAFEARKAVYEHFYGLMPDRTKELLRGASWDLYYGPRSVEDFAAEGIEDWPGYSEAVDHLQEWANEYVQEVWVDMCGEPIVFTEKPEESTPCEECEGHYCLDCNGTGRIDAYLEETYNFDTKTVKSIIFGQLMSNGLS